MEIKIKGINIKGINIINKIIINNNNNINLKTSLQIIIINKNQ